MRSPDKLSEGGWGDTEAEDVWAGALVLRPSVNAGGLDGLISSASGEPTVVVSADSSQSSDTKPPEVPKESV